MASGSSGRSGSGTKTFDFGSDDVLCSYDDYVHQEPGNPNRMGSSGRSNSLKDLRESRNGRPLLDLYTPQEESAHHDLIDVMDKIVKKYTDGLLRLLEGMNGRLSQLELYCYNLEKSIGELRSDLVRDQSETDQNLRSLEKHLQEVHRSVQILRDKQELADAQKELAKLQLKQKESTGAQHTEQNKDRAALPATELKKNEGSSETQSQQLPLALPNPVTAPTQSQPYKELPVQQPAPPLSQHQIIPVQTPTNPYYPPNNQIPNPSHPNSQTEIHYVNQRNQMQDATRQSVAQPPPSLNHTVAHTYTPYAQQWVQQVPPPQPPPVSAMRPQTPPPAVYPPYPNQSSNQPPEAFPSSMPMQVPYSGVSQPGPSRSDIGYSYGSSSRTMPQQQLQHNMAPQQHPEQQPPTGRGAFGAPPSGVGYAGPAMQPLQSNPHGYMMYETEGSRVPQHPHYAQGGYSQQPHVGGGGGPRPPSPQVMRNHPYGELIEKAVSMGFARDQVANAIHWMEESGQPMDFNTLLDRLNGAAQRGW